MNQLLAALLAVLTLAGAGCSTLTTNHPIGHPVDDEDNLNLKFDGIWRNDENDVFFVHCEKDGTMRFAAPEWDSDKGEFTLEQSRAVVRKLGEYLILNARLENEEGVPYHIALAALRGDHLVLWVPEPDKFLELVRAKELEGTFDERNERSGRVVSVRLTGESAEITQRLEKEDLATYFNLREPLLMSRIKDETKGLPPAGAPVR